MLKDLLHFSWFQFLQLSFLSSLNPERFDMMKNFLHSLSVCSNRAFRGHLWYVSIAQLQCCIKSSLDTVCHPLSWLLRWTLLANNQLLLRLLTGTIRELKNIRPQGFQFLVSLFSRSLIHVYRPSGIFSSFLRNSLPFSSSNLYVCSRIFTLSSLII